MRFFYNLFRSTTTQHFMDDVCVGLGFVRNRQEGDDPLSYQSTFRTFVSHELRHVLLSHASPFEDERVEEMVRRITSMPSYRQYRSPPAADVEEQMNKVLDAELFGPKPLSTEDVEIVPIFGGDQGEVLANAFIEALPTLRSSGPGAHVEMALSEFLQRVPPSA